MQLTTMLLKKNITDIVENTITEKNKHFTRRLRSPEAADAFAAFFEHRKPDFSTFS